MTICDGYSTTIVCPLQQTIWITNSWYGRWDPSICQFGAGRNDYPCYWQNYQWIAAWCNGQNSCSGPWGYIGMDPCWNTNKYTVVQYQCR
jgi:hypothetical protein